MSSESTQIGEVFGAVSSQFVKDSSINTKSSSPTDLKVIRVATLFFITIGLTGSLIFYFLHFGPILYLTAGGFAALHTLIFFATFAVKKKIVSDTTLENNHHSIPKISSDDIKLKKIPQSTTEDSSKFLYIKTTRVEPSFESLSVSNELSFVTSEDFSTIIDEYGTLKSAADNAEIISSIGRVNFSNLLQDIVIDHTYQTLSESIKHTTPSNVSENLKKTILYKGAKKPKGFEILGRYDVLQTVGLLDYNEKWFPLYVACEKSLRGPQVLSYHSETATTDAEDSITHDKVTYDKKTFLLSSKNPSFRHNNDFYPFRKPEASFLVHHAAPIDLGAHLSFYKDGHFLEKDYLNEMRIIIQNIFAVQNSAKVQRSIWTPFGMDVCLSKLPEIDNNYQQPEKMQALRVKIAELIVEEHAKYPHIDLDICLITGWQFSEDSMKVEPFNNALAFIHAIKYKRKATSNIYLHFDTDVAEFAQLQAIHGSKVSMVNATSPQMIGNSWFKKEAYYSNNENFHRRSLLNAHIAYEYNQGFEPKKRNASDLANRVNKLGGQVVQLSS